MENHKNDIGELMAIFLISLNNGQFKVLRILVINI